MIIVVNPAIHSIAQAFPKDKNRGGERNGSRPNRRFGIVAVVWSSTAARRDSCLDQLLHQRHRQRFVCGEADRAFAGPETFELVLERFHGGGTHRIERAVIRPRAEGNERTPIQTKRGESVADALLRLGRDGADSLAEFLEGGPLIGIHAREIFVNCPGFGLR